MLNMVNLLENTQKKWRDAVDENNHLKEEIEKLEASASSKFTNDLENDDSYHSTTLNLQYHNSRKKRRSSAFFRRSSSLPARNEVIDTEYSEEDDDCYHTVSKRIKCSQKLSSDDVLNVAVTDCCVSVISPSEIIRDENLETSYDNKPHCFILKRNFIRVVCGRCDCYIRFGVMFAKCSRCKATFHESCRSKAPLPCIARTETPKASVNVKGRRLRLGDYCPDTRPMIPPLIAYCVYFLENNPTPDGLYSNFGSEFEVDSISKLFKSSRNFPKLEGFSPLSVAGCIRKFLGEIREPIIPLSYGKEFISAATSGDLDAFPRLVNDLPTAHMDTLACLCKHWKCFVDSHNISQLSTLEFAGRISTVVFGVPVLPVELQQHHTPITNDSATLALKSLIELPTLFWSEILNNCFADSTTKHTPIMRNPSERSTISMRTTSSSSNGRSSNLNFDSAAISLKNN